MTTFVLAHGGFGSPAELAPMIPEFEAIGRRRRRELWHAAGMPARELAERMGHTKASMSPDAYTHVMPTDEAAPAAIRPLIGQ